MGHRGNLKATALLLRSHAGHAHITLENAIPSFLEFVETCCSSRLLPLTVIFSNHPIAGHSILNLQCSAKSSYIPPVIGVFPVPKDLLWWESVGMLEQYRVSSSFKTTCFVVTSTVILPGRCKQYPHHPDSHHYSEVHRLLWEDPQQTTLPTGPSNRPVFYLVPFSVVSFYLSMDHFVNNNNLPYSFCLCIWALLCQCVMFLRPSVCFVDTVRMG